jgi:hypothetical protein
MPTGGAAFTEPAALDVLAELLADMHGDPMSLVR